MMKLFSHKERLAAWVLLAAIAAFSVFCIFWTPYDEARLLRPIPANAVFISANHRLGPRLENLATNIFLKPFLDAREADLKNLRGNRYAARILASRSIVAYVPEVGQSASRLASARPSHPAFVISSWVGGWTPVLRWALWIHPPRDILPLGEYHGHRLWTCKKPVACFGADNFFSFAMDEGVFIGCLSGDRNGIVGLLRNYDERKDSILDVPQSGLLKKSSPAEDKIWARFSLPYSPQKQSVFAVCSLDAIENDYLSATIRFEPEFCPPALLRTNRKLAQIGKISACSPVIVASFPSDLVAEGLDGLVPPEWTAALKPILAPSAGAGNVCGLTLFTGAYGGKFGKEPFRMTVPTVLLAVSGSRPEQTKAAVLRLLDLINTKQRLGLILNSTLPPAGQIPVFAVESTTGALLKSLPVEDQGAFAFYHDWFLLASNSAGLRKLLLNFQSQAIPGEMSGNFSPEADSPSGGNVVGAPLVGDRFEDRRAQARPLQATQPGNRQKKAFVWIDPAAGGKALRLALMASIIMLNTEDKNPSGQNTIKILRAVRSWLEGISNLENFTAWLEPEDGRTVVRLEIGRKRH